MTHVHPRPAGRPSLGGPACSARIRTTRKSAPSPPSPLSVQPAWDPSQPRSGLPDPREGPANMMGGHVRRTAADRVPKCAVACGWE
eukprot:5153571-Alexandrium_andersonii.AAC.1